mgnify:CR=1 FL=1
MGDTLEAGVGREAEARRATDLDGITMKLGIQRPPITTSASCLDNLIVFSLTLPSNTHGRS